MQSCGSHITQSCYRYMQPQFVFITVPCSAMWIMVSFSFTCSFPFSPCLNSSVITNKNGTSCSSPLCPLPTPDLLAHKLLQTPTYTHPLWWFQCNVMLFCMYICMYVTWPLPFHAIVQQTDAVPPSTLIIPVIPISTVPVEPAVISSSTSQVFFSFSIFPLHPLPTFLFCYLFGHFFLIPAIPLLVDGPEGLSAPESGKVPRLPLTNSICVSTSRRKSKASQKDR